MPETKDKNAHVWERGKDDWYVEPYWATEGLLKVERFVGDVYDPCCGGGNIVSTLRANGVDAYGADIVDRTCDAIWFSGTQNFLEDPVPTCSNIMMNPPYFRGEGTEAFIRKALQVVPGKVVCFVEARFLYSERRASGIYAECPPHRIYVISPRPSCPPGEFLLGGGKAEGGNPDYLWLVWDNSSPYVGTTTHWLKCDKPRMPRKRRAPK